MKTQIDLYFNSVRSTGSFFIDGNEYTEPEPSITGLALFLGFTSVAGLKAYIDNPDFSDIIEYALLRVENHYEHLLQKGVATAKIALKKIGGWDDDSGMHVNVGINNANINPQVSKESVESRLALIRELRKTTDKG
jgi:hypothetical protein